MLSALHIENIAVIESADIIFDPFLNLMTGETGAGKSVIIGALGAILGERVSRDIIRSGAKKAHVSAVFYKPGDDALRWLEQNGIDQEDEFIVSREIFEDGRSVCKVSGKPVTVASLKELGAHLINIHGQRDNQGLLDDSKHLDFLDKFGGIDISGYGLTFESWKTCKKEIDGLQFDDEEKARRIDTLQFRLDEVERAGLQKGEEDELNGKRKLYKNAGKILEALDASYTYLYGDDETGGASDMLGSAAAAFQDAVNYRSELEALASRLNDLLYAVNDCAEEVRNLRDEMDISSHELEEMEARLDVFYKLRQKYKIPMDDLIEQMDVWQKELDGIKFSETRLEKLREQEEKLLSEVGKQAGMISDKRRKAAHELETRMRQELAELDMGKVAFSADFGNSEPNSRGTDTVTLLIATNQGEPMKPLSKIASGGELARIMLALKNILSESDSVQTMVFDEVDSGVSGRAAQRVAQKLCNVSRRKQVICVTHLPQIAAMADTHFLIEKSVVGERTVTRIDCLDIDGRTGELARIVGGREITDTTRQNAAELIEQAAKYKRSLSL